MTRSAPPEATPSAVSAIEGGPPPSKSGGSLRELVAHLGAIGEPCFLSPDGSWAWVQYPRGSLVRLPLERTDPIEPELVTAALRLRGVWLLNYLLAPGEGRDANCVRYACADARYDLARLDRKTRENVRRGLRSFDIRRCSWQEWVDQGFAAHADTQVRHGYATSDAAQFRRAAERWRDQPHYEIWGAWREGALAAWLTILKVDDWAMIDLGRSRTEALRDRPNHALRYTATRELLVGERRAYVSSGMSSIQAGPSRDSLHKYKVDLGYEAIPVHRVFATRRLLQPLVRSRAISWLWDRAAELFPRYAPLRKISGMARLVSGRPGNEAAPAGEGSES